MAKRFPKKQGFSLQGFDIAAYQNTEAYVQAVDAIYMAAVDDFARIGDGIKLDPSKPFSFNDYPSAKRKAQEILNNLVSNVQSVIVKGTVKQWNAGNTKNDAFLSHLFDTTAIKKKTLAKYQNRNLDALNTFQNRKINGLDLSRKIWNYADQFKAQMEMGLDIGIGDGRSAKTLARDLKHYLVDPDKLFRRVRDKHGNLVLSKNAKAFHPGQGKYRSSHKNALRLTRSEINMAYRESDFLRWQQMDFVVGYEVKISNNHPFPDICDALKGKYPKEFKFVGWHPQCRCFVVPILMDMDEFDTDELNELKAAINGTEYKAFASRNTVTDVPDGFKEWISDNADRAKGWVSQPYFIRDNFKGGTISGGLSLDTSRKVVTNPASAPSPAPAAPKSKPVQDLVPEQLRPGSDYMKNEKFTFDNDFFSLLNPDKPVTLEFAKRGGSYHQANKIHIELGDRTNRSSFYKEKVIYHEYGHAIDSQRGLRYKEEIKSVMDKHRKALKEQKSHTYYGNQWDYEARKFKYVKVTSKMTEMGIVSSRMDSLYQKVQKMSEETFKKRGLTKHDVIENICSMQDTIMSLNPNYGWGHTKSYYKNPGAKEAEFIAHAFENAFAGNAVFKKYLPDLYEDMVAYIKALK